MFDLLARIASTLLGLGEQMHNLKRDHRDRIANLLINIADSIAAITAQFRSSSRDVPHERCVELRNYLAHLKEIVEPAIVHDQLSDLLKDLEEATSGHELLCSMTTLKQESSDNVGAQNAALLALDAANGTFRATANLLRAK